MAVSIFGTLNKTGLLADWGHKISETVTKGFTNIKDLATSWYNGATAKGGFLDWVKNIPVQPDQTAGVSTIIQQHPPTVPRLFHGR